MFLQTTLLLLAARQITGNAINPDTFILGGDDVPEGGRPYQVSLDRNEGKKYQHFCGGSILSEKWVITAAHCLTYYPLKETSILSGTTSLTKGGQRHEIEESIVHEKFREDYPFDYDIALLKIKDTFSFDDKTGNISLEKENNSGGDKCIVSGWGYIDNSRTGTDKLKMLRVNSLSNTECKKRLSDFQKEVALTDNQICSLRERRKGICQGDSGGPLTCNGELVGIVSYNIPCAWGFPDVYTRAFAFKDWVAKHMT